MTYPGGEVVTTGYNVQGLPFTLAGTDSYVTGASYDALGRPKKTLLNANGQQTERVYYEWTDVNGQGRVKQIKTGTTSDTTQLQDLRYTYDAAGNVLTLIDTKVLGGTQTQSFAYDHLDRLVSASATGGSTGQGVQ